MIRSVNIKIVPNDVFLCETNKNLVLHSNFVIYDPITKAGERKPAADLTADETIPTL